MDTKKIDEHKEEDLFGVLPKEETKLDEFIEGTLLENNSLVLHGDMTEEACNKITKKLMFLKVRGAKQIRLILNTPGGDIYHGLLIFETLQDLTNSGIDVTIEARGLCASMGVVILMAGTHRLATRYTRFLLHEATMLAYGKASELKDESLELDKVNSMLDDILISKTKLTREKIKKYAYKRDWWFSAEEALKLGIIERIV
jgi:ATP-dependent Clp protease protease subunit